MCGGDTIRAANYYATMMIWSFNSEREAEKCRYICDNFSSMYALYLNRAHAEWKWGYYGSKGLLSSVREIPCSSGLHPLKWMWATYLGADYYATMMNRSSSSEREA